MRNNKILRNSKYLHCIFVVFSTCKPELWVFSTGAVYLSDGVFLLLKDELSQALGPWKEACWWLDPVPAIFDLLCPPSF